MRKKNKKAPEQPVQQITTVQRRDGFIRQITPKAISRARNDIATWKAALKEFDSVDNPKRVKLITLYKDIMLDALLTSQIEQRIGRTLAADFVLKDAAGAEDENATRILNEAVWFPDIVRYILTSIFVGTTQIELTTNDQTGLSVTLLPAQNFIPQKGIMLYDVTSDKGLLYREAREFGIWVFEFGKPGDYGLLNKAIPHALFKRFAQGCWSELCEIYGIPPRFIKTNTQDPEMLDRAEAMLRDMGSAAYFIIDTTEEFQFAKGADTNGDVYNNLISLCNSEMCLLISYAQIGQDTRNGNRSKEEASIKLLEKAVKADKRLVEDYINSSVYPALVRIGVLPAGLRFSYKAEEDIAELWERTKAAMQYFEIDPAWLKEKFNIAVIGPRNTSDGFFG